MTVFDFLVVIALILAALSYAPRLAVLLPAAVIVLAVALLLPVFGR